MKPRWHPETYRYHALHIKHLLDFFGPNLTLEAFNRRTTADYIKHRKASITRPSNATINKEIGTLYQMLHQMTGRRHSIEKLPVDRKPQRHLSSQEEADLLKACRNGHRVSPDLYDAVVVCLDTGLRRGELFRITPWHLDIENKQLTVPISKTHRFRVIPLTPRAFSILVNRAKTRRADKLVFSHEDGTPHVEYLRMPLERAYKRAGLPSARPWYTLRHTFANKLLRKGAPIYEVRLLMGHTTVTTTEIYANLQPQNLHGTIGLIAEEESEKSGAVVEKRLKLVK